MGFTAYWPWRRVRSMLADAGFDSVTMNPFDAAAAILEAVSHGNAASSRIAFLLNS